MWLCGVVLGAGLMLAGCSASVVAQRSGGQVDLGMSIDDFVKMCGQPVGKEMYEENGVRYDRLIYIGVAWTDNRVITTATFENGVLIRQEVEVERPLCR